MRRTVRGLLLVEAVSLFVAAALHAGLVIPGPFDDAAIYEATIALVVLAGLAVTYLRPAWTRGVALATQAFALLGAFVGLFAVVSALGPNSPLDVVYHVGLIGVLTAGLVVAWQQEGPSADRLAPGTRAVSGLIREGPDGRSIADSSSPPNRGGDV